MQREIKKSSKNYPIIGTLGAGPCIIIAVRDPLTNRTALTHVDAAGGYLIDDIFNRFKNSEKVEVYLHGGENNFYSRKYIIMILEDLYKKWYWY